MSLSALASTMMRLPAEQLVDIQTRFRQVDGGLTRSQFVAMMLDVIAAGDKDQVSILRTVAELCDLFAQIDVNGDGTLEWEEFTGFLVEQAAAIEESGITELYKHVATIPVQEPSSKLIVQCAKWVPQLNSMLVAVGHALQVLEADATASCGFVKKLDLPLRDFVRDNDDDSNTPARESSHATALCLEYVESADLIAVLRSDAYVEFVKLHSRTAINAETAVFGGMTRLPKQHYKLVWNATGNKLLSLSNDYDVHVWDLPRDPNSGLYGLGGSEPLRRHKDFVKDVLVAVTDEYRYVVSAGLDHRIYLWDAISGELKGERTDSDSAFSCLAFDASNNLLLAATYHFGIVVWDISSELNRALYRLAGHTCPVLSIAALPSLYRCATLDESGQFIWWDTAKLQLNDANRFIHSFRVAERCEMLTAVIGSSASSISVNGVLLVGAAKKLHVFACEDTRPPESAPLTVLYNPVFAVILTIHSDDVKMWDASTGGLQKVFHKPIDCAITCATFDDRQRKLLLCGQDGGVHVLNFLNGALMKSLPPMPGRPSQLIYVEVDKLVIVTSWSGWLRVYDEDAAPELSVIRQVPAHDGDIVSAAFSRPLGLVATGDYKGLVRVWDFQVLTVLCECSFNNDPVVEITSLLFLDQYRLLAIGDSKGKIVVVSTSDTTRQFTVLARAGPDVSSDMIPSEQRRKFEAESGSADNTQQAAVCMITNRDFTQLQPTALIAGDENGTIRCWSLERLLEANAIQPLAPEESAAADVEYAPRRKRILHGIVGQPQRLNLSQCDVEKLDAVSIWQCHQSVMTSICSTANPAALITAALDEAVKLWSPAGQLEGVLTRGRDMDGVFRRFWHFPIDFEPMNLQRDSHARQVYEEILALRAAQQTARDEHSYSATGRSLRHELPSTDSFWLTSTMTDRVLSQLSGHRTWIPSKRELAAEYTKAKLKQMMRTTSKLLGDKPHRTKRGPRKALPESWDVFADVGDSDTAWSLATLTENLRRRKDNSETARILDRVYSQDPNSWEVGSVNKTRLMYENLSQEYDIVGCWSVDRKAARDLRVSGYLEELLQPSLFLSERKPELVSSLSSLQSDMRSQRSLVWTSMQKRTATTHTKPKRRRVKLHSRSSVVKRRVVLTPIDAQVEEQVVWDLALDSLPSPTQSPGKESQSWRAKMNWMLKSSRGNKEGIDAPRTLPHTKSMSSLSSISGDSFLGSSEPGEANFDDIGHPDEWDERTVQAVHQRTQFGPYKVGELKALQQLCRALDVNRHSTSRTLSEACNASVNLMVFAKHDFIQTRPQFKQNLRRQFFTTDNPPTSVPFSDLVHCLLGQLTDAEMVDVHRFFMLLEHEHRQKHADYGSEQEDALRRLFDMYDLDKNGAIDLDELVQGLSENRDISVDSYVPSEILQKIMDTVDKDSNRQLDYEEFRVLFTEAF